MLADYQICNAQIVTPDEVLDNATLTISDGIISALSSSAEGSSLAKLDAKGQYLLPGFVDLHCDAVERAIEPRPGSFFPVDVALAELDKQLAACGVTTIYHSLSFAENEIGIRSNRMAASILRQINQLQSTFGVRTRVHSRFEITDRTAVPVLQELIQDGQISLFSVMDHSPGQGQFNTVTSFKNYYGPVYKKSDRELDVLIAEKLQIRNGEALDYIDALLQLCQEHGVSLASHDDDSPERIHWLRERHIALSEFPINLETASAAKAGGIQTLLGSPNVVRGQSQSTNLNARDAIAQGAGDILCSDYAPMTLVHAVFLLQKIGLKSLPEAVRMTSHTPACAVGIDRQTGSIEVGKSADLVLVGNSGCFPQIQKTFVQGRKVFSTC